jgi:hypothetical protein
MTSPAPIKPPLRPEREYWVHEHHPYSHLEEIIRRFGDEKAIGNITLNVSGGKIVGIDVRIKFPALCRG